MISEKVDSAKPKKRRGSKTPLQSQGASNRHPLIRSQACLLDLDAEARSSTADVYCEDRLRGCEAQSKHRWNLDIHLQHTGHQGGGRACVEHWRRDFQYLAASHILDLHSSLDATALLHVLSRRRTNLP